MTKDTVKDWVVGIVGAVLILLVVLMVPFSDPALPEVVYDRDCVPWTQDGERIEEEVDETTGRLYRRDQGTKN